MVSCSSKLFGVVTSSFWSKSHSFFSIFVILDYWWITVIERDDIFCACVLISMSHQFDSIIFFLSQQLSQPLRVVRNAGQLLSERSWPSSSPSASRSALSSQHSGTFWCFLSPFLLSLIKKKKARVGMQNIFSLKKNAIIF